MKNIKIIINFEDNTNYIINTSSILYESSRDFIININNKIIKNIELFYNNEIIQYELIDNNNDYNDELIRNEIILTINDLININLENNTNFKQNEIILNILYNKFDIEENKNNIKIISKYNILIANIYLYGYYSLKNIKKSVYLIFVRIFFN